VAGQHFEHYRLRDGLLEVMNLARAANKYFNDSEPWKTAQSNRDQCATTINISVQLVRALVILMEPVIPDSSDKVLRMLGLRGEQGERAWDSAGEMIVPDGHRIGKTEILFSKIEDSVIAAELDKLGVGGSSVSPAVLRKEVSKPIITIDDFKKIDLRVARVISCENVPKSEKLLKLQVEIGTERRQIIAGIAQHYRPSDLIGRSVVVVFNLEPATLMGQESQGMLLAATDKKGRLVIISPAGEIEGGSVVK
jgi:methionyl-tRNA synthetase